MNNKCINLRVRSKKNNRYFYCIERHSVIDLNECRLCDCKSFKKSALKRTKTPLKKVSKKRAKLERNRKSVFTNNFNNCIEPDCNNTAKNIKIDSHECIGGSNRLNSIKYDLVVPLCRFCHEDKNVLLKWKLKAQDYFVDKYGYDLFIQIFKIDYKEKHKKRTLD